jgi:hypothetical protein
MADSAPAASAPASGGDSTAPSAANTNTETKGGPKGAVAAAPAAWGDEDDAKFFEMAKRSPYRAKIKGEEKAIDSKESLRDLLNHAQRGIGASKVVEDAKREAAEAKTAREEAAREKEILKRAQKGDRAALKELGLLDPREARREQEEWESVPEPVRELYEERNAQQKRADELQAKWDAKEQEEQRKREEVEIGAAKRTAMNETHKVAKMLGITDANAERYLPHVAGAIADLGELGLELGVDMTPELIAQRFKEIVGGLDEQHFSSLAPEKAFAVVSKQLDGLDDAGLLKAVPQKLAQRIARAVARSVTARRAAGNVPPVQAANDNREEREPAPKVLSFGQRWK